MRCDQCGKPCDRVHRVTDAMNNAMYLCSACNTRYDEELTRLVNAVCGYKPPAEPSTPTTR